MKIQPNFTRQIGASLVEAVVTVGMLAVGLVALANIHTTQMSTISDTRQSAEAEKVAKTQMEQLRTYSVLENTAGFTAYNNISSGSQSITGKNATYNASWVVTNETTLSAKKIDLTVQWTDSKNVSNNVRMVSYISNKAPIDSGRVLDATTTNVSISPGNNEVPIVEEVVPTVEEVVDEVVDQVPDEELLGDNPEEEATPDNGTTTVVTDSGNTLVYSASDEIISINDKTPYFISGVFDIPTSGQFAPTPAITNADLSITPSNTTDAECFKSNSNNAYSCVVGEAWSGTMVIGEVGNVNAIACTNASPYSNVASNFSNQDYHLIKTTKSCSNTSYTTQHSTL